MISDFVRRFWAAGLLAATREAPPSHTFIPEMWIFSPKCGYSSRDDSA
jgi:hypothetical protein